MTSNINVKTWRRVSPHSIRPGTLFSFSTADKPDAPNPFNPVYLCTQRPSKSNKNRLISQRIKGSSGTGKAFFNVGSADEFNTKFFRVEEIS